MSSGTCLVCKKPYHKTAKVMGQGFYYDCLTCKLTREEIEAQPPVISKRSGSKSYEAQSSGSRDNECNVDVTGTFEIEYSKAKEAKDEKLDEETIKTLDEFLNTYDYNEELGNVDWDDWFQF